MLNTLNHAPSTIVIAYKAIVGIISHNLFDFGIVSNQRVLEEFETRSGMAYATLALHPSKFCEGVEVFNPPILEILCRF